MNRPEDAPYAWLLASSLAGISLSLLLWRVPLRRPTSSVSPLQSIGAALLRTLILGAPLFWALAVLFGASLLSPRTLAWGVMQACHSALPWFLAVGSARGVVFALLDAQVAASYPLVWWPSLGALLGSWLSSVVVPLDWEQAWQVWPIPCIYGCLCGSAVGVGVGAAHAILCRGHDRHVEHGWSDKRK